MNSAAKHPLTCAQDVERIKFGPDGLVPVVAQDATTGAVLMLAYANKEALLATVTSGQMTYFSRSRQARWVKGETSGNTQRVVDLSLDCDLDAVLARVEQTGPACHEGTATCWSEPGPDAVAGILGTLDRLAADRRLAPAGGYTDTLLADVDLAAAKVEEEAAEVARVLRGEPNEDTVEHEAADLLYHLIVALRAGGSDLAAALHELRARHA